MIEVVFAQLLARKDIFPLKSVVVCQKLRIFARFLTHIARKQQKNNIKYNKWQHYKQSGKEAHSS